MFERYTESARRVLFFARYEASQLGHLSIHPEHLLFGMLRENKGITARILSTPPLSFAAVRAAAEKLTPPSLEKVATSVEIPFGVDTKRILIYTAEEADRLNHSYIAPEHMLVAMMREEQSVPAIVLRECGLEVDEVRARIVVMLNEPPAEADGDVRQSAIARIKTLVHQLANAEGFEQKIPLVEEIESALDGLQ